MKQTMRHLKEPSIVWYWRMGHKVFICSPITKLCTSPFSNLCYSIFNQIKRQFGFSFCTTTQLVLFNCQSQSIAPLPLSPVCLSKNYYFLKFPCKNWLAKQKTKTNLLKFMTKFLFMNEIQKISYYR